MRKDFSRCEYDGDWNAPGYLYYTRKRAKSIAERGTKMQVAHYGAIAWFDGCLGGGLGWSGA